MGRAYRLSMVMWAELVTGDVGRAYQSVNEQILMIV